MFDPAKYPRLHARENGVQEYTPMAPPKNRMPRKAMLGVYPIHKLPVGGSLGVQLRHISGIRNHMYRLKKEGRGTFRAIHSHSDAYTVFRIA